MGIYAVRRRQSTRKKAQQSCTSFSFVFDGQQLRFQAEHVKASRERQRERVAWCVRRVSWYAPVKKRPAASMIETRVSFQAKGQGRVKALAAQQ